MPPRRITSNQQTRFLSRNRAETEREREREQDTWACVAELDALWTLPARIGAALAPDIAIHVAET